MTLKPCPSSPNCVSTLADATDSVHYIKPLSIGADPLAAMNAIEAALTSIGATITSRSDSQIDAVVTSKLFRFKDDVTIVVDGTTVHARSASRVGHSDLGANRKRITALFAKISAARFDG